MAEGRLRHFSDLIGTLVLFISHSHKYTVEMAGIQLGLVMISHGGTGTNLGNIPLDVPMKVLTEREDLP